MPTLHPEDLLEVVQAIEACSARMLQAAREGDWTGLAEARSRCTPLIDTLRAEGPADHWPRALRHARLRVMARILQNEACIRRITSPGAARLDALIAGAV